MDKSDRAGDGWNEDDVTAVCVIEGRPHVQVVKFNRNQEGLGKNAMGAPTTCGGGSTGSATSAPAC